MSRGEVGTTRRAGARWRVLTRRPESGDRVLARGTDDFEPRLVLSVDEDGEHVRIRSQGGVELSVPWFHVYPVEEM